MSCISHTFLYPHICPAIVTSSYGNYARFLLIPALLVIKNWNQNLKPVLFLAAAFERKKKMAFQKSHKLAKGGKMQTILSLRYPCMQNGVIYGA